MKSRRRTYKKIYKRISKEIGARGVKIGILWVGLFNPHAAKVCLGRPARMAPLLAVLWSTVAILFFGSMGVKNEENPEDSTGPLACVRIGGRHLQYGRFLRNWKTIGWTDLQFFQTYFPAGGLTATKISNFRASETWIKWGACEKLTSHYSSLWIRNKNKSFGHDNQNLIMKQNYIVWG